MSVRVHKAVEPGNLSVKGKRTYRELLQSVEAGGTRHAVFAKYDGVYAQFIHRLGVGWEAFSRTGEPLPSVSQELLDSFFIHALPERRYMGELWVPGEAHAVINGRARKKSPQHLELKLFDSVHENDGKQGREDFGSRREFLFRHKLIAPAQTIVVPEGTTEDGLYDMARDLKARGANAYDGLILRDLDGFFEPGDGKDGETIKIKPRASGDFRVVGTTRGVGARAGGIGALILDLGGGVRTEVGTGLTKAQWEEDPELVLNRIAEVEYLSVTRDGKLREPSFKAYRFDKSVADVLHTDGSD